MNIVFKRIELVVKQISYKKIVSFNNKHQNYRIIIFENKKYKLPLLYLIKI